MELMLTVNYEGTIYLIPERLLPDLRATATYRLENYLNDLVERKDAYVIDPDCVLSERW